MLVTNSYILDFKYDKCGNSLSLCMYILCIHPGDKIIYVAIKSSGAALVAILSACHKDKNLCRHDYKVEELTTAILRLLFGMKV